MNLIKRLLQLTIIHFICIGFLINPLRIFVINPTQMKFCTILQIFVYILITFYILDPIYEIKLPFFQQNHNAIVYYKYIEKHKNY